MSGNGGRIGSPFDDRPSERSGRGPVLPRILVVDDSRSARTILQAQLLRLGVALPDLRMASSVPEAMQWFTQWNPELVFVDLELRSPPTAAARAPPGREPETAPGHGRLPQDGAELSLLFLERNPGLRVVICSAAEPEHPEIRAHAKAGRIRVIVKPVLAAKVQEILESFRLPATRGRSSA